MNGMVTPYFRVGFYHTCGTFFKPLPIHPVTPFTPFTHTFGALTGDHRVVSLVPEPTHVLDRRERRVLERQSQFELMSRKDVNP